MSDEDKKGELLPIQAQQLYILARQGKEAEAAKLFSSLDLNRQVLVFE
jgi:hypothetical protein